MTPGKKLAILILGIMILSGCDHETPQPDNMLQLRPLTYEEQLLLKSSNEFSFNLMRMLDNRNPDQNSLFSSFGIGNGIGMAFNIIEDKPKEELKDFLKISEVRDIEIHRSYFQLGEILNKIDQHVQFTRANSLWINQNEDIDPLSGDKIMAYYDADVSYLNFGNEKSIRKINHWITDRTFGRMDHIVKNLDASDKSYIINVIDFNLEGSYSFQPVQLDNYRFYTSDGRTASCASENLYTGEYSMFKDQKYTLLDIPVGEKKFYLTLIIPVIPDDIHNLIKNLTVASFSKMLSGASKQENSLLLPDMKINEEVRLKQLFPQLGLSGPIGVIPNYYPVKDLFISDFIHKTSLSFYNPAGNHSNKENGSSVQTEPGYNTILVNRPFLFLIREKFTGAIILTGKYMVPETAYQVSE